jgi:nucleoside-diphosphate-sugar epimerase
MIIGNGLMSKALKDIDLNDYIFFASGVSDSETTDESLFNREKNLLLKTVNNNKTKKIIYFSTCDVYDSSKNNSLYLKHKLNIENIIKNTSIYWLIFRVSQVIGIGGNKNNLLYKLCSNIVSEKNFLLYPNYDRNLVHISELKTIILIYLSELNKIINIANPFNIKVEDIVKYIEEATNKKAIFNINTNKNLYQIPLDNKYPFELFNSNTYYKNKIKRFVQEFIKI